MDDTTTTTPAPEATVPAPEPVTDSAPETPVIPEATATLAVAQESTSHSKHADESSDTLMAVFAYLGLLVIVPLLAAKERPFVRFHIKQGLVLVVGWALVWAVQMIVIPFNFLAPLLWFALFVLSLLGILNAVGKKEKELPVVGPYAKYFDDVVK